MLKSTSYGGARTISYGSCKNQKTTKLRYKKRQHMWACHLELTPADMNELMCLVPQLKVCSSNAQGVTEANTVTDKQQTAWSSTSDNCFKWHHVICFCSIAALSKDTVSLWQTKVQYSNHCCAWPAMLMLSLCVNCTRELLQMPTVVCGCDNQHPQGQLFWAVARALKITARLPLLLAGYSVLAVWRINCQR